MRDCGLDFATASDPFLLLALWASAVLAVFVLLLVMLAFYLRLVRQYQQRRERRVTAVWRPVLSIALDGWVGSPPVLKRADRLNFLMLWNRMHDSIRGAASEHLNEFAHQLGVGDIVLGYLRAGGVRKQLIAMKVLGHLRDKRGWSLLSRHANAASAMLSCAAACALMKINEQRALHVVVPLMASRIDWPVAQVSALLKEVGSEAYAKRLAQEAADTQDPIKIVRLMRYLAAMKYDVLGSLLRDRVTGSCNDEVILAVLPALRDQADLDLVRGYARHANWRIRTLAARALGRIGMPADEPLLVELLADRSWWVRVRAAGALAQLPFITTSRLQEIQAQQTDHYAFDSLASYTNVSRQQ